MRNMVQRSTLVLVWSACAPPPEVSLGTTVAVPSIELLYPEQGQVVTLDADCVLVEPLVVVVRGVDLTPPAPDDLVEGQGHWHGGPDLAQGYCVSSDNACSDYDGTGLSEGPANLFVQLQDNGHNPLAGDQASDQVEISIEAPATCP